MSERSATPPDPQEIWRRHVRCMTRMMELEEAWRERESARMQRQIDELREERRMRELRQLIGGTR